MVATYNFAVVIDDHDMPSLTLSVVTTILPIPKQLMVYEALGWEKLQSSVT